MAKREEERIAQEALAAAKKLAEEKAKQELLAQQAAEAKEKEVAAQSTKKYTVQLLSLSNFSQERLNTFCKKYKLPVSSVTKRKVGTAMKITYGEVSSIQEAKSIQAELRQNHGIKESFITKVQ